MSSAFLFSTIEVTRQVFYRTSLTYAMVNIKPIVPGRKQQLNICAFNEQIK
jgi:bis(5'-adenosyl)-triphosphatase